MMTGNTAIHIASQLQSGAPRKAAFLVAVRITVFGRAVGPFIAVLAAPARRLPPLVCAASRRLSPSW